MQMRAAVREHAVAEMVGVLRAMARRLPEGAHQSLLAWQLLNFARELDSDVAGVPVVQ